MRFSTFVYLSAAVLCSVVSAAPTNAPGLVARDCSAEISAYNLERRAKRSDVKRSFYPKMLNEICVLAPNVARKDYVSIGRNLIRQDVTEGQVGVPFILDIGVLDITTCQPVSGAMVEIWSANAVGNYGQTFLRGAFPSEDNGIAEFNTIFPGFTSEGANHINIAVHTGSSVDSPVTHNGQLFFTDPWTNIISMSTNYNQNTHTRILNNKDHNFVAANSNGYTSIVDIEEIHDDWPAGIIGYITVGINPTILV